jgi:predicted flap endonuclease-1-like 5' DNA nuclease
VITVVLEIIVCLVLAGILGLIVGWFLHKLRVDPASQAMERLVASLQEAEGRLLDVKAESRIQGARAQMLETEIRSKAIAAKTMENEISSLSARLSMADKSLDEAGKERDEIALELAEVREQLIGASAQIEEARLKLAEQERTAARMQKTIEELTQTREISVTTLAEKSREMERLRTRLTDLEAHSQADLAAKSSALAAAQERTAELEAEIGAMRDETEQFRLTLKERDFELDRLEARIAELEQSLQKQAASPSPVESEAGNNGTGELLESHLPAQDGDDDLTVILGIGPKLAQLLHSLGVRTFRQMALWSDEEIDRVDAHLKGFRGRIRRDRWVERARAAFYRKYGKLPEKP